jgi:hypothetical protein
MNKNSAFVSGYIIYFVLVLTTCSTLSSSTDEADEGRYYFVSIPSADEEAQQLVNIINMYKWFTDNKYFITLPNYPLINSLKNKVLAGGSLSSSEVKQVKNFYKNEIYKQDDYQRFFTIVNNVLKTADEQIPGLIRYKTTWGFFIPKKYNIRLTLYSPGGLYNSDKGIIIILVQDKNVERVLQTILHETVHIGIEKNIIQKYNIQHWTKERIVDQFLKLQFIDILPNYGMQSGTDTSIDIIFQEPDVLDKLPQKIQEYFKNKKNLQDL